MKRIIAFFMVLCLFVSMLGLGSAQSLCPGHISDRGVRLPHSWGSWKVIKVATCSHTGTKASVCQYCGERKTKTISKTDHKWSKWTVATEAGSFSTGLRKRTCSICGKTEEKPFYPDGTLKSGDKGQAVKDLQKALNDHGFNCGKADGKFGKKTEKAVKAYEKSIGAAQDGIAWPQIIAALEGKTAGAPETESEQFPYEALELRVTMVSNKSVYGKGDTLRFEWRLTNPMDVPLTDWSVVYSALDDQLEILGGEDGSVLEAHGQRSGTFSHEIDSSDVWWALERDEADGMLPPRLQRCGHRSGRSRCLFQRL